MVRAFAMDARRSSPEWDADVMMARPALRLDADDLPRFELDAQPSDVSDDAITLELPGSTQEIQAEDILEIQG